MHEDEVLLPTFNYLSNKNKYEMTQLAQLDHTGHRFQYSTFESSRYKVEQTKLQLFNNQITRELAFKSLQLVALALI